MDDQTKTASPESDQTTQANSNNVGPITPKMDPGKTLSGVGMALSIILPLAGLVVSIIALKRSKKAGMGNQIAEAGIVMSIFTMLIALYAWSKIVTT